MKLKPREVWKEHPEFTDYAISNMGRVKRVTPYKTGRGDKNIRQGKLLSLCKNKWGYLFVCLRKNGFKKMDKVHRFVLETFIGPCPKNHECNHKDGDKKNNKLSNLEWTTKSENLKHAYRIGLKKTTFVKGEQNGSSKLKEFEVLQIRKLLSEGNLTQRKISQIFKVSGTIVYKIKYGIIWSHI